MIGQWISLKSVKDPRGILTSVEESIDIPIDIKRIFYMHHVTEDRGGHAHIDTDQVIIPISGSFKLDLFDGIKKETYDMCNCMKGLYVKRLTFTNLYNFTSNAVCLVLANTHYDIGMSLRSLDAYMDYINSHK